MVIAPMTPQKILKKTESTEMIRASMVLQKNSLKIMIISSIVLRNNRKILEKSMIHGPWRLGFSEKFMETPMILALIVLQKNSKKKNPGLQPRCFLRKIGTIFSKIHDYSSDGSSGRFFKKSIIIVNLVLHKKSLPNPRLQPRQTLRKILQQIHNNSLVPLKNSGKNP